MQKPRWNEIAFTVPLTGAALGWFEVTEYHGIMLPEIIGIWILGAAGALGLPMAFVALSRHEPRVWITIAAIALNILAIMPAAILLVAALVAIS